VALDPNNRFELFSPVYKTGASPTMLIWHLVVPPIIELGFGD
jgi:hypothetical protein